MGRLIREDDLFTTEDLEAIDEITTLGVMLKAIYETSQEKESWLDDYLPTVVETTGRKLLAFAYEHYRKVSAHMYADQQEQGGDEC